ncbi:MAG: hypothetical protein IJH50_00775 [Kiritimatiellae bacterium]|nr:hypothetical protein [Kiritimatiellia bacterium]
MKRDEDLISEEELFDDFECDLFGEAIPRTVHRGRKRPGKDLFREVKEKMIMRIYGVSRTRAREIISCREREKRAAEAAKSRGGGSARADGTLMGAEEFFRG